MKGGTKAVWWTIVKLHVTSVTLTAAGNNGASSSWGVPQQGACPHYKEHLRGEPCGGRAGVARYVPEQLAAGAARDEQGGRRGGRVEALPGAAHAAATFCIPACTTATTASDNALPRSSPTQPLALLPL